MKKWWEESYIHKRTWILENYKDLDISSKELILLLCIDLCNEKRLAITLDQLSYDTKMNKEEVDQLLSTLSSKRFLSIVNTKQSILFNIDGIFEKQVQESNLEDLFELFESEFARPLSQNELVMLQGWQTKYEKAKIIHALREASIYQKLNFYYIDRILLNQVNHETEDN